MGELVNATKKLCSYVCIEVQREAERHRRRRRSLDEGWDGVGHDDRPAPAWEVGQAQEAYEAEQRSADIDAFVAWAMPQLVGKRRDVVELTLHGAPLSQICAQLALSKDNAYQLRSRGLKDLAKLHEQYGT
jgi:hypothetical protein